jgi:hypothetical protein
MTLVSKWSEILYSETSTSYMRWDGEDVKIKDNVPYRYVDGIWQACDEKKETKYYDGLISTANVPMFKVEEDKISDGMYTLVGPGEKNPYGFKMFMLLPWDFYVLELKIPVTLDSVIKFLKNHEVIYGILFRDGFDYSEITRKDLALEWPNEGAKNIFANNP